MTKYNHEKIENNWKDYWYKDNIYEAVDFSEKPKKYILAELPYPSGKSLHVGHMMRYTVPEIYSRYLRMRGNNVLFPMGWDSFGLPAETYAKKAGITPQDAIAQAAVDYKKAMQGMGYAIDWDREINTADPKYYKWTQWTFKRLWEEGLAMQKEMPVWWCDELGVLADEEVLPDPKGEGKVSERGGHAVERKMFKQWVLNIPSYADKLIADLDKVDYEESVKQGQLNWIGRKEGTNIIFDINGKPFKTFTTRPDTLFGVTFLALAPNGPGVTELLSSVENKDEVEEYIERAASFSDLEKQTKEKTGVLLKGITAKHPFSEVKREIPVFLADYILLDYGTGVVMGVPGHDERDNEFAKKYALEIIDVVKPSKKSEGSFYTGGGTMMNSDKYDGISSEEFAKEAGERLEKEKKGEKSTQYKLRPQVFSRQRYWGEPIPLVYKENGEIEAIPDEDLPVELPYMDDFLPGEDGISPLAKNEEWVNTKDSKGKPAKRETDTMPTWAGSNWYYLRYIDPNNDKALVDSKKVKYWFPIDKYFGDAGHTTAHLLYSRFWYKFLHNFTDLIPKELPEPYMYRMSGGMLLGPDGHKMSKSRGNVVDPQEVLDNYGADAVRTYLAFIGPYDATYPWNPRGLVACARLVKNIYELREKVTDEIKGADLEEMTKKTHLLTKKVTEMMEKLKMNTSVSEFMIITNYLRKEEKIPQELWLKLIRLVAPFMPFVAEELWQEINGHKTWKKENSVHLQDWPKFDEKLAAQETLELPVQVNGKVRARLVVERDISEEVAVKLASENDVVSGYTKDKDIKKVVYVKNKILNFVV